MTDVKATWKDIWEKKSRVNNIVLECLFKANGYNSLGGNLSVDDFKGYVGELFSFVGIEKKHSIFDVGCGSGAFVYEHFLCGGVVGGIDYSSQLIGIAKGFMPNADFLEGDARKINTNETYDVVTSLSVFQYFDDLKMAETVLGQMCKIAKRTVAVLDIIDDSKFDIYHSERIEEFKKNGLLESDYWEKYRDLKHLFYSKDFFQDYAVKSNLDIKVAPQTNINYENSKMRFNVVFSKK